jgi:hypothetical protein
MDSDSFPSFLRQSSPLIARPVDRQHVDCSPRAALGVVVAFIRLVQGQRAIATAVYQLFLEWNVAFPILETSGRISGTRGSASHSPRRFSECLLDILSNPREHCPPPLPRRPAGSREDSNAGFQGGCPCDGSQRRDGGPEPFCNGGRCAADWWNRQGAEGSSGVCWTGRRGERTGWQHRRRSDGHRLEGKWGRRDRTRHAEFGEKVGCVPNSASTLRSADTSGSAR